MRDFIEGTIERTPEKIIQRALLSVRSHLGMEIAYLSEFEGDQSVFRAVDAPGLEAMIKPGDSRHLDEVYCRHIIAGRLPRLIPDTANYPLAVDMPITTQVPIGSHVSVPIRRDDGSVYGMFCCLSPTPNPSLNDRDLSIMEVFADLCADQINGAISIKRTQDSLRDSILHTMNEGTIEVVFQPIVPLSSTRPSGFEALSRFRSTPYRTPDLWFADAARVGLGLELEAAAIRAALPALTSLPRDVYLSVNASPALAASGQLERVFAGHDLSRLMLELTEHAAIADFEPLLAELSPLRAAGLTLAIDDAGAGYSGLQQIIRLAPDVLKLDMSLTRDIDTDPARRSLAAAMVHFATEQGSTIVAEGIETAAELATLRAIGVHRGQGWHLGKPVPLADAQALLDMADQRIA